MSSCIFLALLVVAAFVLLQSNAKWAANKEETEICKNNAKKNNRTMEKAEKEKRMSCKVTCRYTDGCEDEHNSPEDQLCCDLVGVGPTGKCKNGSCPIGGKQ